MARSSRDRILVGTTSPVIETPCGRDAPDASGTAPPPAHAHTPSTGSNAIDDPVAACRRYFDAIAARDADAVLDTMTTEYGEGLRKLRRADDFSAFFSLWCETEGRLVSVLSWMRRGEHAEALVDCGQGIALHRLRLVGGRWYVAGEQELGRAGRRCQPPK